jgi:hypothetical protein
MNGREHGATSEYYVQVLHFFAFVHILITDEGHCAV